MEQINVNLIPKGVGPVCHASQYDKGRVIRANLFDNSDKYVLSGTETITIEVRKPDGNIVTAALAYETSTSYVDIITTEQMTAVKGRNLCNLSIAKGNTVIGTTNFFMIVEVDPTEGGIESESDIENLQTQVNQDVINAVEAGLVWKDVEGVLLAGQETLTLTSEYFTDDCMIDIYTSVYGVSTKNVELSNGSITLTFKPRQSDLNVKVRVT